MLTVVVIGNRACGTQGKDLRKIRLPRELSPRHPPRLILFDNLANSQDVEFYQNAAAMADLPNHSVQNEIQEVLFGLPRDGLTWQAWVESRLSKGR